MNEHTEASLEAADEPLRHQTDFAGSGTKRIALWICVAVAALVAIAWIIHHGKKAQLAGQDARGRPGGPMAVATATATVGDLAVKLPALGTVTPLATVTVKTQISGQLQHIAFTEWQLVRQGDFLAQIDPRPYQAALAQSQGNLQRDQSLLTNARLDLKRYQGLAADNTIARQQLDTQQSLVTQYEATVATDTAQLNLAKLNLQYTHIVSPVAGRVGLRQVDQGNYVTPGDANGIVVVTQLQPVSVLFPLPEDNLPAIQKRLHAGATLAVEAYDRADTVKLADGKLQSVDNQIDTATGTVRMRALFDNQDGALFANQFVNVRLLQETLTDQVIIPVAAVQHGAPNSSNSTFVYLVGTDHTVAVRPVVLGAADGERVAVNNGLQAGDVVVTEGGDRLRDGATVTLPAAAVPGPAGSAVGAPGTNGAHKHGNWHRNGAHAAPVKP